MSEQTRALVAVIIACVLTWATAVVLATQGSAQAREVEPDWMWKVAPSDRTNTGALLRIKMGEIEQRIAEIIAECEAEQAALEAEQQAAWEVEQYYEPVYYEPTYYVVSGDPDGLNSYSGRVDWNGQKETAYSSKVLYHYRTSEWTPDEYGFYRTDDGYYVVASNDYEEGTVIETSRGEAMVLDGGCDSGVVDFYVNW